jgi:hypothetical protein
VTVVQNVFEDVNRYFGANFNANGILLQILTNTQNVYFSHNTGFPSDGMLSIDGKQSAGLYFADNIINHGPKVISYQGMGGTSGLNAGIKSWTMTSNVMVAPPSTVNQVFAYPGGNFFPASYDEVGFINCNGGLDGDYRIRSSSPYKGEGTDGTDIGAHFTRVVEATQGVVSSAPGR